MTIAAARKLRDGDVCFVGIGKPSAAANLARITHAPGVVLIYESGTIGAKPDVLPLSIGDGELADNADTVVSVPEIFRYWLQGGRVDVGFLGAAQIDKYANLNTTIIGGSYEKPKVRLPGAGGAPEIASGAKEIWIIANHSTRMFVEKLDFCTSAAGNSSGKRAPTTVISDLGVMVADSVTGELTLTGLHPGVSAQQVIEATGWDLKVAAKIETTPEPTDAELTALRDLYARTAAAHGALGRRGIVRAVYICDAVRTPFGRFGGVLANVRTDDLAAVPIRALIARNGSVDWKALDDVVYGCANQAGEDNRNVARMAALLAGLPVDVPGTTVNRLVWKQYGCNRVGGASD